MYKLFINEFRAEYNRNPILYLLMHKKNNSKNNKLIVRYVSHKSVTESVSSSQIKHNQLCFYIMPLIYN